MGHQRAQWYACIHAAYVLDDTALPALPSVLARKVQQNPLALTQAPVCTQTGR